MPNLAPADLLREIASEKPPQRVFICGEDTAAVVQLEKRILKKLTEGDPLAYSAFDGQAPDLDRMADACAFCPMFQPCNVILVHDLDPDAVPAASIDTMLKIWGDLPSQAVVLVVMRTLPAYEIKRGAPVFLQKFKKITSFFEKQGVLCICEKKNAIQLGKQIMDRAKRHGCEISRQDAEMLANRCLCDTTLIQSELDKLIACADGEQITRDMLDALTAELPDANAYRLATEITLGHGAAALHMLADLTAKSEDTKTILGLLSIISNAFVDLYRAKLGMGSAKQADAVSADFSYPKNREFAVRNAIRDCARISLPQLRTCVRILRETDRSCKSTRTPPRLLLEQAIVRMLRVQRDGSEVLR